MKRCKFIFVLYMTISTVACNSWLDVNPKSLIDDEHLFSDYRGFRNSLNGIYNKLSSGELYGRNLSWGFLSALAQTYNMGDYGWNHYLSAQFYNYENADVKSTISTIWRGSYQVIANCNKLIQEIDKRDSTFFPLGEAERCLIYGEALAIRAFVHFDLLRLFAPAPILKDEGNYIPYFETFGSTFEKKCSVSEIMTKVKEDLENASRFVARYDTLMNYSGISMVAYRFGASAAKGGDFFKTRATRMNFVAIRALLARVYMYEGDVENAGREARYIYDNYVKKNGWYGFTYSGDLSTNTLGNKYIKMYDDILLAFFDWDLIEHIADFKSGQGSTFSLASAEGTDLYEMNGDKGDLRRHLIYSENNKEYSYRWAYTNSSKQAVRVQYRIIPIIRLGELYYIMAESYYKSGKYTEAENILKEIRRARGLTRHVSAVLGEEEFMNELKWEYKKEFLTEGEVFFMFKRLNAPILSGHKKIILGKLFVLPVPDNENIY